MNSRAGKHREEMLGVSFKEFIDEKLREEIEKRFEIAYELIHEDGMSEDKAFRRARITEDEVYTYASWLVKRNKKN